MSFTPDAGIRSKKCDHPTKKLCPVCNSSMVTQVCVIYSDFMGFYSDLMGFYGDLMGFYGDLMGIYGDLMGY